MLHPLIRGHDDTVPGFPFAPSGWQPSDAEKMATEQGIELSAEHVETLRALQEYFFRHDKPDVVIRELHDALDERFHSRGGMKYLYNCSRRTRGPGLCTRRSARCPPRVR